MLYNVSSIYAVLCYHCIFLMPVYSGEKSLRIAEAIKIDLYVEYMDF
jgi:hypothetical protein